MAPTTRSTTRSKNKNKNPVDSLGPQWSRSELERFYAYYREHGQQWTKVAAAIPGRSVEMVESLFDMNRTYLSLPEEMASSAGFVAKMCQFLGIESRDDEIRSLREEVQGQLGEDIVTEGDVQGCLRYVRERQGERIVTRKRSQAEPTCCKNVDDLLEKFLASVDEAMWKMMKRLVVCYVLILGIAIFAVWLMFITMT